MAKMNSILGEINGKLGEVVGQNWMGKRVLRKYTPNVTNPNTAEQQTARAIFAEVARMSKGFAESSTLTLRSTARNAGPMTAHNLFVKKNYDKVSIGTDGKPTVDFQHLSISEGQLKGVAFGSMSVEDGLDLTVNFTGQTAYTPNKKMAPSDQVYVFAYCDELNEGVLSAPTKRSGRAISMSLPSDWVGQKAQIYGFVVGAERKLTQGSVSNSHYIGSQTLA